MSVKNIFLNAIGFIMLGLGAIGLFFPILPTTPFVLVASACFANNPRIQSWLHKSKFFGEHLDNYKQRTGLKKSTVAISLAFLWIMLGISMLVMAKLWSTLLLSFVGICVTIHILCIAKPRKMRTINVKTI